MLANETNSTNASLADWDWFSDPWFTPTHAVVNLTLAVLGIGTTITLIWRNLRCYIDSRMKSIVLAESHILLASLIVFSVYLPLIGAEFMSYHSRISDSLCFTLTWLYGTMHITVVLTHAALAVAWMIRVNWPWLEEKVTRLSMMTTITLCWLLPLIIVGVHVLSRLPSNHPPSHTIFCMNDLTFRGYLSLLILPSSIITLGAYSITSLTVSEWKKLAIELSPRLTATVHLSPKERALMAAHSSSYLLYTLIYLMWRALHELWPLSDKYSVVSLHATFLILPLICTASNKEIMGALVHPCRTCWRLIRKEPAISDSDGILEPPPYSPYGPRDFANQPPPYMNHIASQPLGEWEESVTPINQPVTVQRESTTNQSELRIFTISSEERITGNEDSLGRGLEHRNSQSELTQHSVTQTVTQSSITTDSQDEDGPINPSTPSTGLLSCHESPSRDSLTGTVCEATLHQSQARVEPVTVENLAIVTRF